MASPTRSLLPGSGDDRRPLPPPTALETRPRTLRDNSAMADHLAPRPRRCRGTTSTTTSSSSRIVEWRSAVATTAGGRGRRWPGAIVIVVVVVVVVVVVGTKKDRAALDRAPRPPRDDKDRASPVVIAIAAMAANAMADRAARVILAILFFRVVRCNDVEVDRGDMAISPSLRRRLSSNLCGVFKAFGVNDVTPSACFERCFFFVPLS